MTIAVLIPSVVISFFLWAVIHEASHTLVVRILRRNAIVRLYPYPHRKGDRFYFARAWWSFEGPALTPSERAMIYAAPRIPDVIGSVGAVVLVQLSSPTPWTLSALILVGGSVVDLFVGSIGWHERSDLRRVSQAGVASAWSMRVLGMLAVILTIIMCTLTWL